MQKIGEAPFYDTPGVLGTSQTHFICYFILKQEFHSRHLHVRLDPSERLKLPLKSRGTAFLCGCLVVLWSAQLSSISLNIGRGCKLSNSPQVQRAGIVVICTKAVLCGILQYGESENLSESQISTFNNKTWSSTKRKCGRAFLPSPN